MMRLPGEYLKWDKWEERCGTTMLTTGPSLLAETLDGSWCRGTKQHLREHNLRLQIMEKLHLQL